MVDKGSPISVSFSGCGFIGLYHVGVAACFKRFAPFLLKGKMGGASAGAIAASALIGDVPLEDMTQEVLSLACQANEKVFGPFNPSLNVSRLMEEGLKRTLPDDIHVRASGRLHVSLSRVCDRTNIIVNAFESKDDLVNVIIGSSFVPMMSGFIPPKYRGEFVLDGGITDNVPIFDSNTITVSPFSSSDQDICPLDDSELGALLNMSLSMGPTTSVTVNRENMERFMSAMLPPGPMELLKFCQQGYDDAYRFLSFRDIIQCQGCVKSKDEAGYFTFNEWKRKPNQDEECADCKALLAEETHKHLPRRIAKVFEDTKKEVDERNSGLMASISRAAEASVTIGYRTTVFGLALFCRTVGPRLEQCLVQLIELFSASPGPCPFALAQ